MLGGAADGDLAPFHNRIRHALAAVMAGRSATRAGGSRPSRPSTRPSRPTPTNAPSSRAGAPSPIGSRSSQPAARTATPSPRKRCAASAPTAADLKAFDAALDALLNRAPEQFDAALRGLRLAGVAGFATFVERSLAPRSIGATSAEPEALTPVELQVLRSMTQGLGNQAIADEQRRTVNTIRTHVSSILRKLGCANRGEAVAEARRRRLV